MDWFYTLSPSDWVIAGATFLGPIIAVQIQRMLDRQRQKNARRINIFRSLMATRAQNLSPEHVHALNAVPIDFYGFRDVLDRWEEYYAHLNNRELNAANQAVWGQRRIDLFNRLLSTIATNLRYRFNEAEIAQIYAPEAHRAIEDDQQTIQRGLALLFRGEIALPMTVINWPGPNEVVDAEHTQLRQALLAWLRGQTSVRTKTDDDDD